MGAYRGGLTLSHFNSASQKHLSAASQFGEARGNPFLWPSSPSSCLRSYNSHLSTEGSQWAHMGEVCPFPTFILPLKSIFLLLHVLGRGGGTHPTALVPLLSPTFDQSLWIVGSTGQPATKLWIFHPTCQDTPCIQFQIHWTRSGLGRF